MRQFPLSAVDFDDEETAAVSAVLRDGWLTCGRRTAEFEEAFAAYTGSAHAVAVSSCTTALHLALMAGGVGPGDEVLVPSYTFVASANAVRYQGAQPVFVEIGGPADLNLAVADLERKLSPRTKAIVVVHMAGFPAEMGAVMRLARDRGLRVVEDACHAIGASYHSPEEQAFHGRKAGSIGDFGCFSFYANKNMVTGEGGMVVTDDPEAAAAMREARSHGMRRDHGRDRAEWTYDYDIDGLGYNYRCTELTAALGLVQLGKLDRNNAIRRQLVARYRERLGSVAGLELPFAHRLEDGAHHIFPILTSHRGLRPALRRALDESGVQTSVHYPPVHQLSAYAATGAPALPLTEDVASREITLPLHPLMTVADVDAIGAILEKCWRSVGEGTGLA